MQFEWDENKNIKNIKKHGICFENAIEIFEDPHRDESYDYLHSNINEDRYKILGLNKKGKLIVATVKIDNECQIVRLISARKPTNKEKYNYYGKNN